MTYLELYLSNSYILILCAIVLISLIIHDFRKHKNKKNLTTLLPAAICCVILSINEVTQIYIKTFDHFTYWRVIQSTVAYCFPSLILYFLLMTFSVFKKEWKYILLIPILLLAVLVLTTQQSHLIIYFTEDNLFFRGHIWLTPFIIGGIYSALFIYPIAIKFRDNKTEASFIIFIFLASLIAMFLDAEEITFNQFSQTLMMGCLVYYLYLYLLQNKTDYLTGLYNRKTFYSDLNGFEKSISAVISMDINGLKKINDTFGHLEGDKAIKTCANSFVAVNDVKMKVYRVGGDEFNALVFNATEDEIIKTIEKMSKLIKDANYSCSFGYIMNKEGYSIEKLIKDSDKMMYQAKDNFYQGKSHR